MEMKLEQSMAKTTEYQVFAERYPHITESIKLKREMERLKKKLKSEKKRSSRFQIKREMNDIRTRLRKQSILKRLHGESKQEAIFHTHFIVDTSKKHVSSLATRCNMTLRKTYTDVQKRLRRLMYRNLPPSVFDLKSLDTAEKGLALREWVQNRCKKRR